MRSAHFSRGGEREKDLFDTKVYVQCRGRDSDAYRNISYTSFYSLTTAISAMVFSDHLPY